MKKFLPAAIVCFLFSVTTLFAQQHKLTIGIEAGPNYAFMGLKSFGYDPAINFSLGAPVQFNISKLFSVHTGLAFERKGRQSTVVLTDNNAIKIGESTNKDNFDYAYIPLLARFGVGNNVRAFANAGFFYGYLYNKWYQVDNGPHIVNRSSFQYYDAGFSIGIGTEISLAKQLQISLEVRNNKGFIELDKYSYPRNYTSQSVNCLLGIAYKLVPTEE